MPKTNEQQPTTQPDTDNEIVAETGGENVQGEPSGDVLEFKGKGGLIAFTAKRSAATQNKAQLLSSAHAAFKEAAKLSNAGTAEEGKATAKAADGALKLYQGMIAGVLSTDEVTDVLGTDFGWKTKPSTGEQSKTPKGLGEQTRKRVVRAFRAYDYAVAGNEPIAFFEPLEREAISPIIHQMEEGTRSIWTVFNDLAEMKAEATGKRPKLFLDPRRIVAISADMGSNVANTVKAVQNTPGLFAAYAGLLEILLVINQELPAVDTAAGNTAA